MKKIQLIGIAVYFLGLGLKLFHLPKNTIVILIGLFLLLISCFISIRSEKIDSFHTLQIFTITSWLTTLLFLVKFWSMVHWFLGLSLILTGTLISHAMRSNGFRSLKIIGLLGLLTVFVYFIPTSKRYYLISLHWSVIKKSDYYSWDKYSWFLYKDGHFKESLDASNWALDMAKEYALEYGEPEFIEKISDHKTKIENKKWSNR